MCRLPALLLLSIAVQGQSKFQIYNTENGLPNNSVLAIRQTRDGYLWFTTYRGLVRFDGVHFRIFDPSNTPELRGTNFATSSLFEDHQGALWAGSWSSGAIRYQDGKFTAYTTRDGLPNNDVVRIDEDRQGTIWIFTHPGISRLCKGRIEIVHAIAGEPVAPFLNPPSNLGIDAYLCGLWRFTPSGLQRFAYGQWSNIPLPPLKHGAKSVHVDSLLEDVKGRLWLSIIGQPRKGYCVKDGHLSEWKGLPPGAFLNYQDRLGRLWISDHQGHTGLWQNERLTTFESISTVSPYRVFEDREGGFWVGTLEGGLAHGTKEVIQVFRIPGGHEANVIGPITEDGAGNIWVGSYGLTELNRAGLRTFFRPRPHVSWRAAQMPNSLFADGDGSILCGYPNGLAIFKNGRFRDLEAPLHAITSEIDAILRDRTGTLWLGGEEGLYRYSHCKLDRFNAANGPVRGQVRTLFEDSSGTLWIGTDVGICQRKGDSFFCFGPKDELSEWGIRSIVEDTDHVIWAGTAREGILRIDRGSLTSISAPNGLRASDATALLEDLHGYFWTGCQLGIYRVKKQELNDFARHRLALVDSTMFGTTDGLNVTNSTGHGQPSGFRDREGVLWLPTKDGLARINPRTVEFNSETPVVIEDCAVEQRPIPCQKQVTLPAGANDFEIRYTALSLIRSNQIVFRYRLGGLNSSWTEAGNRRTAYFSHLPPGTFHFTVAVANSGGVPTSPGGQLSVIVLPRFYQTFWFQVLVAGSAICLFALAWRLHTIRFSRQQALRQAFAQQVLASQEIERKRIAGELHDGMGQHLSVIKNTALLLLTKFAGKDSYVECIAGEASQAITEMRRISYDLRPYQLDLLGLSKAVEELARRCGEAAHIQMDIVVDDLTSAFAKEKEIHFYRIVQECLNNILKHSHATLAQVLIQRSDPTVLLVIHDNGRGFLPNKMEADPEREGFGLFGLRERVHLLGGAFKIQSTAGTGTTVSIEFHLETAGRL